MSYRVELLRSAERELRTLQRDLQRRVARALRQLHDEPRPAGVRKLREGPGWRVRVGDYRILYAIDDDVRLVSVFAIRHRSSAYRR